MEATLGQLQTLYSFKYTGSSFNIGDFQHWTFLETISTRFLKTIVFELKYLGKTWVCLLCTLYTAAFYSFPVPHETKKKTTVGESGRW